MSFTLVTWVIVIFVVISYNDDNFDDDRSKIKKTMPNIATLMTKKIMKASSLIPLACEKISNDKDDKDKKCFTNIKLCPSYKECLEALKAIE